MEGGEDAGYPWQEPMIIGHHAYKLLLGSDGLRSRKTVDCVDFALGGRYSLAGEGVAKELDLRLGQGALLGVEDETILS